jgi:hypothetical protein
MTKNALIRTTVATALVIGTVTLTTPVSAQMA